jgi:hypothetical protein
MSEALASKWRRSQLHTAGRCRLDYPHGVEDLLPVGTPNVLSMWS